MRVAVLVDGGFFLQRWKILKPQFQRTGENLAKAISGYCCRHLKDDRDYLYRIFYYDCPPLVKKLHHPISKKAVDYAKNPESILRIALFEALKKKRKVALRLGYLSDWGGWRLKEDTLKELLKGTLTWANITDAHFYYDVRQKGVDSRIACDIASLAFKKLVDKIILIAGDADFVPAAKLGRREGIDFVLDPLHHHINPELHEHIDGCHSIPTVLPRQRPAMGFTSTPGPKSQNHIP